MIFSLAQAIFHVAALRFSAHSVGMAEQPKEPSKELFKHCTPAVKALAAEGRKQCRLKARREWKAKQEVKP